MHTCDAHHDLAFLAYPPCWHSVALWHLCSHKHVHTRGLWHAKGPCSCWLWHSLTLCLLACTTYVMCIPQAVPILSVHLCLAPLLICLGAFHLGDHISCRLPITQSLCVLHSMVMHVWLRTCCCHVLVSHHKVHMYLCSFVLCCFVWALWAGVENATSLWLQYYTQSNAGHFNQPCARVICLHVWLYVFGILQ